MADSEDTGDVRLYERFTTSLHWICFPDNNRY